MRGASINSGSAEQTYQACSLAEQQELLLSSTAPMALEISSIVGPTVFYHNLFECFFLRAVHLFLTNRQKMFYFLLCKELCCPIVNNYHFLLNLGFKSNSMVFSFVIPQNREQSAKQAGGHGVI